MRISPERSAFYSAPAAALSPASQRFVNAARATLNFYLVAIFRPRAAAPPPRKRQLRGKLRCSPEKRKKSLQEKRSAEKNAVLRLQDYAAAPSGGGGGVGGRDDDAQGEEKLSGPGS